MFYEYRQNNSGGAFKGPAVYVFIEADSADEANERAASVGIYFNGVEEGLDCGCCGDRWYPAQHYTRGMPEPLLWGEKPLPPPGTRYMGALEVAVIRKETH